MLGRTIVSERTKGGVALFYRSSREAKCWSAVEGTKHHFGPNVIRTTSLVVIFHPVNVMERPLIDWITQAWLAFSSQ